MLFLFFFTEKWMTKSYNPNKLSCIPGRILDIFLLSLCVMSVFPLFCVPIYLNNMNLPILLPSILPQAEEHELWDFALKQNYLVNFVFGSVIIVGSLWVGQLFLALSIFCFLYTRKSDRRKWIVENLNLAEICFYPVNFSHSFGAIFDQ